MQPCDTKYLTWSEEPVKYGIFGQFLKFEFWRALLRKPQQIKESFTSWGCVSNGPSSLFSGFEFGAAEYVNEDWKNVAIDNALNLRPVSRRDIGNGPTSLFSYAFFGSAQKLKQTRQNSAIQDDLGLNIVTSHNVANSPQSSRDHRWLIMH